MNIRLAHIIITALLLLCTDAKAQQSAGDSTSAKGKSLYIMGISEYHGEIIPCIKLPTLYVYAPIKFKSKRQQKQYNRLVRDVKKVLPLAIEIRTIIIETYELLQKMPDEKAKKRHIEKLENELKEVYTPKMKKLTLRQGKLLIKLVDRQCDQNAYQLVRLFMGSFKAAFYQSFASMFGASLKKSYDPEGEDALVERVVILVTHGVL